MGTTQGKKPKLWKLFFIDYNMSSAIVILEFSCRGGWTFLEQQNVSDNISVFVRNVSSGFCNGEMRRDRGFYSKKSGFTCSHPQMICLFAFTKTFHSDECLHNISLVNRLSPWQHPISLHVFFDWYNLIQCMQWV